MASGHSLPTFFPPSILGKNTKSMQLNQPITAFTSGHFHLVLARLLGRSLKYTYHLFLPFHLLFHVVKMPATTWQEGDIAFLNDSERYNNREYDELIDSGYMHPGATGHPCIILKMLPGDRVVVTTISAYGSGVHNQHAAPWISKRCYSKDERFFRSFQGSECSRNNLKPLQLIPGQEMPKPETSWLFIKNVYDVPLSVIGRFTKPCNKVLLKMTPESLADLRLDIASRSPNYDSRWGFVDTRECIKKGSTSTTKGQPRAMLEAPAATSCERPTASNTINAPPAWTQRCHGSAPMLRTPPTTIRVSSTQAAPFKSCSWAAIASKPVAPKPKPSTAPRRTTFVLKRTTTPWVKALA
ncbi:hypothetical protein CONLIGDRAFT_672160 [Coniochaeta ligniaria NRRL 30616]|uniref:Uncharacterized protein n=1 Tax=Coniochaeta ligniaria NRRL 30616 TaxID=1408157 RepID=A0A1J7IGQ5_9PEZI|nr:hypothetical protein CONLIGDRAFT_672160 [Coniochaeta ligniaria NRRL 30616]